MTQDKQNPSVFQRIQLFTVAQVADALELHPSTIRRLIRRGDLAVVRIGVAVRLEVGEVAAFIERRRFRRVLSVLRSGGWAKAEAAWEKYESGS
jgi:excisionase family DNA binding protein